METDYEFGNDQIRVGSPGGSVYYDQPPAGRDADHRYPPAGGREAGREGFRGMEANRPPGWEADIQRAYRVDWDPLPPRDPLLPPRPGTRDRPCGSTRGYACGHPCQNACVDGIVPGPAGDTDFPCGAYAYPLGGCSGRHREGFTGGAEPPANMSPDWIIVCILLLILVVLVAMGSSAVGYALGKIAGRAKNAA